MINGVSPTPHQLAGDIWYLSLQDRIDFWEIMQKMNFHGEEAHRTKGGDTFVVQNRNQTQHGKPVLNRPALSLPERRNLVVPLESVALSLFYGNGFEPGYYDTWSCSSVWSDLITASCGNSTADSWLCLGIL